jgi:alcohol dehydrogenase, propanol-preferring
MKAMVLQRIKAPLNLVNIPVPVPNENQLLIRNLACGICRTDLHIVDGELPAPHLPLILGHQIVGIVEQLGANVQKFHVGDRVGVPWLQGACGHCSYCLSDRENLCDQAVYTGYQVQGGFAEYSVACADFCFQLPSDYSDLQVAPLLCAGLIGYRALRMTKGAKTLGFYGFGASAHILTQVASYQKHKVYAFTREGDHVTQEFALKLGCVWAGGSEDLPPVPLDAAIIFAPVGNLVPIALRAVTKGGIVICAGIHMSDIPSFPYSLLWEERVLRSVANLTRLDGREFLALAPKIPVETQVTVYPLEKANEALNDLRTGKFSGAGVLKICEAD